MAESRAPAADSCPRVSSDLRLMLIDRCRQLETVHGLLRAQLGRQLDKAQQASPYSMGNKQRRQMCAGLDGYQGRPFPRQGSGGGKLPTRGWSDVPPARSEGACSRTFSIWTNMRAASRE
jgi:hypothetical protein